MADHDPSRSGQLIDWKDKTIKLGAVALTVDQTARADPSAVVVISTGSTAPTGTVPDGSLYTDSSGNYYIRRSAAWAQQGGVIADPGDGGAIPVTGSGTCAITTTGVDDTRTLAIPSFVDQRLVLTLDTDAGDAVTTVASAFNIAGNNTITFADIGDTALLVGVSRGGTLQWSLMGNDAWVASTV